MERLVALDSPASGQALTPQPFLAARHTTEPETLLSMNVPLVLRHKDLVAEGFSQARVWSVLKRAEIHLVILIFSIVVLS